MPVRLIKDFEFFTAYVFLFSQLVRIVFLELPHIKAEPGRLASSS
jgi:hypothetical protein